MDFVFLHITKKPTSSTVLIIVVVVFHYFAVFPSEPVDEDTAVGGGSTQTLQYIFCTSSTVCTMAPIAENSDPSFMTGSVDLT